VGLVQLAEPEEKVSGEDAIVELRDESRRNHSETMRRFDSLEVRVTALETEGLPNLALKHLKRIDIAFNKHLTDEELHRRENDRRLDEMSAQMTTIASNTTQTSNVLSRLQADLASEGRKAGAKAGLAAGIGFPVVAGVAYAILKFFAGG